MPGFAQELRVGGQIRSSGVATSDASKKVVSRLRGLIADAREQGITSQNAAARGAASQFSSTMLEVDNTNRVRVYVSVTDTREAALAVLRQHGLDIEIVNSDFGVIQGWIPIEHLEALAAEPVVTKIRPPSYGRGHTGSVNTQGDSIHRCDGARAQGLSGTGIKV